MRIVNIMLSTRFGGIGQAYIDYNECLLARGHEVLAIYHRKSIWNEKTRELDQKNGKLITHSVSYKGGPLALLAIFSIRRKVKAFRPDVIIIHNYLSLNLIACRGLAPVVSITHMYKAKHFQKLDGVIALTKELKEMCIKKGIAEGKIHIVPNMINGPFSPPFKKAPGVVTIGGLGRLDIVKGYRYLIEACDLLKKDQLPFKLLLGGTGFEEENLKNQVKTLGLEEQVEFAGYIKDKGAFFDRIDIFCVPSTSEPFGITILEGMKYGKPIVTSDIGGPACILSEGLDGLLVPPADSKKLATALRRLIEDSDFAHELANQASKKASLQYSSAEVGLVLENTLTKLQSKSYK